MFGRQSSEGIKLALKSASLVPGLGAKQQNPPEMGFALTVASELFVDF